jgi:hypothetical protein
MPLVLWRKSYVRVQLTQTVSAQIAVIVYVTIGDAARTLLARLCFMWNRRRLVGALGLLLRRLAQREDDIGDKGKADPRLAILLVGGDVEPALR